MGVAGGGEAGGIVQPVLVDRNNNNWAGKRDQSQKQKELAVCRELAFPLGLCGCIYAKHACVFWVKKSGLLLTCGYDRQQT